MQAMQIAVKKMQKMNGGRGGVIINVSSAAGNTRLSMQRDGPLSMTGEQTQNWETTFPKPCIIQPVSRCSQRLNKIVRQSGK